ncbi:MAG: hypothetical protein QXD54_05670 [Candidatus Aenigmatarchaeota archaeon]
MTKTKLQKLTIKEKVNNYLRIFQIVKKNKKFYFCYHGVNCVCCKLTGTINKPCDTCKRPMWGGCPPNQGGWELSIADERTILHKLLKKVVDKKAKMEYKEESGNLEIYVEIDNDKFEVWYDKYSVCVGIPCDKKCFENSLCTYFLNKQNLEKVK